MTALHYAVRNDHRRLVGILLQVSADMEAGGGLCLYAGANRPTEMRRHLSPPTLNPEPSTLNLEP